MFPLAVSQRVNWKSTLMQYASVACTLRHVVDGSHEMRHTPPEHTEPHAQSLFCVQNGAGRRLSTRHAPLSQYIPEPHWPSVVHSATQAPLEQIVPAAHVTLSQLPGAF